MRDGRRRSLLGVLHIIGLEIDFIFISKMSDVSVHTIFEKDSCKMVRGVMILMRGARIGI